MVTSVSTIRRQELSTEDGKVYAYVLPAEEVDRLRAEIEDLREAVATLQRQKKYYVAELTRVLQTSIPIPPTDQEIRSHESNSADLHKLIADLKPH